MAGLIAASLASVRLALVRSDEPVAAKVGGVRAVDETVKLSAAPRFTLLALAGVCGDGVASAQEDCDGGRGCSNTCTCDGVDYVPLLPRDSNCGLVSKVDCIVGEYEVVAPTWTSERVCDTITQCLATQWEKRSPTAFRDRICETTTVCNSEQYTTKAATTTSDAQCALLSVCGNSRYASVLATATSDRICSGLLTCQAGQYESRRPTATSNRLCNNVSTCVNGQEYEVSSDCCCCMSTIHWGHILMYLGSQ